MDERLNIDYYTDVLCIWAWIAQRRTDELAATWGERININYRYVNVFGDTRTRIGDGWADRGGYDGFRDHVVESAAPFDNAPVNPDIWSKVQPATSANAHLVLSAIAQTAGPEAATQLAAQVRHEFFVEAQDISELDVLYDIAARSGIEESPIRNAISNGLAAATLMQDYQRAAADNIAGSPTWVLNQGRQKLYGNVGFHVLNANVEGMLAGDSNDASWC